jgi:hypothetical protein
VQSLVGKAELAQDPGCERRQECGGGEFGNNIHKSAPVSDVHMFRSRTTCRLEGM